MSATTFDETYARDPVRAEPMTVSATTHGYAGEQVFIWLAWALAFAFWAFAMSSFFGILKAIF